MAAPTFLQVLKYEVGRMQAAYPEREGEIARACALILHGMVLPTDDPDIGQVLSSDGEKHYSVNGTCSCQAGQHGKPCKHLQAWRLYQYISRKVLAAQPAPQPMEEDLLEPYPDNDPEAPAVEPQSGPPLSPLPEAPVSITLKATLHGQEIMVTLRGHDFASVKAQVEQASQWLKAQAPAQSPAVQPASQGKEWCAVHQVSMQEHTNAKGRWFSHYVDGRHCKGRA
jgi:hypothetical protein